MIVSDYYDQVKYIDPDSGSKYLTNTSRWIDGKLYYFDKDGYRRNDVSSIYGGPYYLEVDKTNGVMTVYTNSSKTIPVKTIRVSVGLSGTTYMGWYIQTDPQSEMAATDGTVLGTVWNTC